MCKCKTHLCQGKKKAIKGEQSQTTVKNESAQISRNCFRLGSKLCYSYEQVKVELFSGKIIKKISQRIRPNSFVVLELC